MVFGKPAKIGYYPLNNRKLVSVTSAKEFAFGIPETRSNWIIKQTLLATMRKQKELKRYLTQKEALEFGREARLQILETARNNGQAVHKAIEDHIDGSNPHLDDEIRPYFDSFINWSSGHKIKPILQEERVYNFDYGYAGRFDFYGEVDGKKVLIDFKTSNHIDWTFGLQLAAYRKCLENLGHEVDEMWVLHLVKKSRGSEPTATLHDFKTPFRKWEAVLELFHERLGSDPNVLWIPRTDEAALEEDLKWKTLSTG